MILANPLLSLRNDPAFQIPIYFSNDEKLSYIKQLKKHYLKINYFLKSCKHTFYEPLIKEDICNQIFGFQNALIDVIRQYLEGHPAKSFELFEKAINDFKITQQINSLIQIQIPKNSLFFRLQRHNIQLKSNEINHNIDKNFKTRLDLFHPPFQRRRLVSTNRFSIPGYPCLYLSNNIHTSYSECFPIKDENGPFHAICFKNIRPLYFIDLSQEKLMVDKNLFEGILPKGRKNSLYDVVGFFDNLAIYQLILASHTKINYQGEKVYFKIEYVIPQLLLQWLNRQRLSIDGIRYSSCTADNKFSKIKKRFNYVLPVVHTGDKGYCPSLASLFLSTKVYSLLNERKITYNYLSDIAHDLSKDVFSSLFL